LSIITAYSVWLILICLALASFTTWLLYFYRVNYEMKKQVRSVLAVLRFLFVFLLSLLLLSPLVLLNVKEVEKPLLVFAQDNSKSILYASDSAFYRNDYLQKIRKLSDKFRDKYDFRFFTFDQKVIKSDSVHYNGDETSLYALFEELKSTFAGRNVGALVLASDGIYNKGGVPTSIAEVLPFPIYSIMMGDTVQKTDLAIRSVDYNRTTFYKNTFPVEVQLSAYNLTSRNSVLTVSSKNQELFSKQISISNKKYFETVRLYIDANQKGLQKFHISVKPIDGEFTTKNNEYDIFVNVRDARDKILITYQTVHPDIAAIKQALLETDMYQVDVKQVQEINKPLNEYRAIFAYQLPDVKNSAANLFSSAKQWSIPIVYVLGTQSSFPVFNQLNAGVQIGQKNNMWNDVFPSVNPNFVLFSQATEFKQYLDDLPPLVVPFGSYSISNSASIFLYQRIGNFSSTMPLVLFNDQLGLKNCIIAGEGIWKWRLACYQHYQHYRFFDDLINKIPQYLVAQSDNSNFRVKINQLFSQNESITATAELYNLSLELDNSPEVSFTVTNSQGKEFPFVFSRENRSYSINIGLCPQGEYRWMAKTKLGDKDYQKSGAFMVQDVNLESLNLMADFSLMRSLAMLHGGKIIPARNVEEVAAEIEKNPNIKPISFFTKSYNELANSWIYWALLLLLAVSEWFIRKFNGLF